MKKDIDNIQYLAENMLGRTFCPLGDAAAMRMADRCTVWKCSVITFIMTTFAPQMPTV